jgi:hypothetical protein
MIRRRHLGYASLLILAITACSEQRPSIDADLVLENVDVISMASDSVDVDQSVFIKNGVIVEIAHSNQYAPNTGATIVEGAGKFLIPGLADMHVHVFAESELPLYVANGITLVRNMWGEPVTLAMRDRVESGEVIGPRIVTAGRLVDGDPPIWGEMSGVATSSDEARALMDEQRQEGFDFFKIYSRLSADTFDGIAAYSREIDFPFAGHVPTAVPLEHALNSGISTIEHLTGWNKAVRHNDSPYLSRQQESDSGKRWANVIKVAEQLKSGELTTADLFDLDETRRLARVAAANGVWHLPTHAVLKRMVTSSRQAQSEFERPEMRFISPGIRASWDPSSDFRLKDFTDEQLEASQIFFNWNLELVGILHEAGVPLLAGTDPPNPFVLHGFAIHEELQYLVDAGLNPYQALVTATRAPAEFLGELDEFGTIEVGKRADLVLLDANPLDDISATRQIAGVVLQGTWRPTSELDEILEGIAASFELPDDWFDGVDPLSDSGNLVVYDRVVDNMAYGAARAAIVDDSHGARVLKIQERSNDGGELKTGIYDLALNTETGVSSLDFTIDGGGAGASVNVLVDEGVVTLLAQQFDGTENSQQLALPVDGLLLVPIEASMVVLVPRLNALAVGESIRLDVIVLDTFGWRLVQEVWTLSRNENVGAVKAFTGTSRRGGVESGMDLRYDTEGIVSFSITTQFGTALSTRRN